MKDERLDRIKRQTELMVYPLGDNKMVFRNEVKMEVWDFEYLFEVIEKLDKGIDKAIYNLAHEDTSDPVVVDEIRMQLMELITK